MDALKDHLPTDIALLAYEYSLYPFPNLKRLVLESRLYLAPSSKDEQTAEACADRLIQIHEQQKEFFFIQRVMSAQHNCLALVLGKLWKGQPHQLPLRGSSEKRSLIASREVPNFEDCVQYYTALREDGIDISMLPDLKIGWRDETNIPARYQYTPQPLLDMFLIKEMTQKSP